MKLYSSPTSPYARKARVIAHELGLDLDVIDITARGNMEYRRVNPLGKVPALVLDDGSVLFDSPVVCEYLNKASGGKFFPEDGLFRQNSGRWKALTLQALGDGILDAIVACVYEDRYRPAEHRSAEIVAYARGAIGTALDVLEGVGFAAEPTIGEISVGCALGFLDFRLPDLDWRAARPRLAEWYTRFSQYPSMLATVPR